MISQNHLGKMEGGEAPEVSNTVVMAEEAVAANRVNDVTADRSASSTRYPSAQPHEVRA